MSTFILFYLSLFFSGIALKLLPSPFDWQVVSEETDKTQGIPILASVVVQYWEIGNNKR